MRRFSCSVAGSSLMSFAKNSFILRPGIVASEAWYRCRRIQSPKVDQNLVQQARLTVTCVARQDDAAWLILEHACEVLADVGVPGGVYKRARPPAIRLARWYSLRPRCEEVFK